jgi:hypothetical protein
VGRYAAIPAILSLLIAACTQNAPAQPGKRPSVGQNPERISGSIHNGTYRNSVFEITYKVPFGWVDRTTDMRHPDDSGKSLVLLAVFEHPPEVSANTINSAVVIAAERVSTYSGLKTAADYLGPIMEIATSKGFHPEGDPYEFQVGQKQLPRADFSKPRGSLTMYQTSLGTLEKGYALSLTFIGGSKDEIEELIENLSFGRKRN